MRDRQKSSFVDKAKSMVGALLGRHSAAETARWKDRAKALFPWAAEGLLERNRQRGVLTFDGNAHGTGFYAGEYEVVMQSLTEMKWVSKVVPDGLNYCFMWGSKGVAANVRASALAAKMDAVLVVCEDGFLRSADTWANLSAPDRYRHGCSVVFDTLGHYFDATRPSSVENMLNDPALCLTDAQRTEARRVMERIVAAKLTKYNHQPVFVPQVGRPSHRKVLVVDQSYGDMAIAKGWGSDRTFADMLEDAKRENPDADILVKTHPDTMTGKRGGYYTDVREEGNVFRVTMPVNPYSLMEIVDKVYVCSTQMGFEALMAGKEVHVYGMPFYAGWGLTIDKQKNPRRTNRRTLEEVFYIFYLMYTHWVDIETGSPCAIDKAIDNLIALRDEYRKVRETP